MIGDKEVRMLEAEIRLAEFLAEQVKNSTTYFGYPEIPRNNDLSILGVSGLAKLHLNNAGDPSVHGNAKMHTKDFEREVLSFVADLYDLDDYWGYITSGGTEGNLFGMYMGRDYFKGKSKEPQFFYTESSHYSIPKNAHLLDMCQHKISTHESGEINYVDFKNKLSELYKSDKDCGYVINLNIGTTMTGAMDKLSDIYSVIDEVGISREDVFVHADAALMGFIYPFLECKEDLFAMGLNSIAMSGHKFPGTIHPCGVVLSRKDIHEQAFDKSNWVPYVGTNDTTISGSRNGFLALNFWYIIQNKGVEGFRSDTEQCIENAQYLKEQLLSIGYPNVGYNENQIIVTFKKPSDKVVKLYQLATQGDKAHVVVMQHINKSMIDKFCSLLKEEL